ncbi:3-phosphoshikimate 1-carboxyvinyltransferase [Candidatus Harpocratesius sp.]
MNIKEEEKENQRKMQYCVNNFDRPIFISFPMIGSKSVAHRTLIISAFLDKITELDNIPLCDDVLITIKALRKIGIRIDIVDGDLLKDKSEKENSIKKNAIKKAIVYGNPIFSDKIPKIFNFQNSASSFRFFMSILSLFNQEVILTGNSQMQKRPVHDLVNVLRKGGAKIKYLNKEGFPPIQIKGTFSGGSYDISTSISSQFASSLILISPFVANGLNLNLIGDFHSIPYISQTCQIMQEFGYNLNFKLKSKEGTIFIPPNQIQTNNQKKQKKQYKRVIKRRKFFIEGDYSGATYFLVAGAIMGGKIEIYNLIKDSLQGDKFIIKCLEKMGCNFTVESSKVTMIKQPDVLLKGITLDLGNNPDLLLPLSIAAIFADSPSVFYNISHVKYKESNRISALAVNLRKLGVHSSISDNSITIFPNLHPHGGIIDSFNDHRIVMSFAVAGLKIHGIILNNPLCVNKSFPEFFEYLEKIKVLEENA